jgi:hypothetical protein
VRAQNFVGHTSGDCSGELRLLHSEKFQIATETQRRKMGFCKTGTMIPFIRFYKNLNAVLEDLLISGRLAAIRSVNESHL